MGDERTPKDKLREQYFQIYPFLLKAQNALLAKVKWYLRSVFHSLEEYERIEIETRIKDCESTINALERKFDWGFQQGENYKITDLKDLVGIRILVFPKKKIKPIVGIIKNKFSTWNTDHESHGSVKIYKYDSYINRRKKIQGEIQVVPMLTGLFWKVEHFAFYKPHPSFYGIKHSPGMDTLYKKVLEQLAKFEEKFEEGIKNL